ncbi:hypothetical protein DFH27DRAFT_522944 [Peziza echinospora]|nr:hypothetical protein DFH27DRAFT_522944 [Peziza echinospora]
MLWLSMFICLTPPLGDFESSLPAPTLQSILSPELGAHHAKLLSPTTSEKGATMIAEAEDDGGARLTGGRASGHSPHAGILYKRVLRLRRDRWALGCIDRTGLLLPALKDLRSDTMLATGMSQVQSQPHTLTWRQSRNCPRSQPKSYALAAAFAKISQTEKSKMDILVCPKQTGKGAHEQPYPVSRARRSNLAY